MKSVKIKLAIIIGGAVLLTMAAMMGVFNWAMTRQIDERARAALDSALHWDQEFWDDNIYLASVLYLDNQNYSLPDIANFDYTQEEKQISEWCQSHQALDATSIVTLGSRVYYIRMSREDYGYEEEPALIVAYVDITSERALITSINGMFLLILAAAVAGGIWAGYAVGRQIEHGQAMQKRFYENMSHELKTPLTSIRGFAEGLEAGILEDTKQAAHIIGKEAEKMTDRIEDTLCLSKLESRATVLHREHINMAEFVENCLLPLEGAVKSRGLKVELQLGTGSVQADPDQMEHALTNVLTNAIKYADSRITVQYEGGRLVVWNDGDRLSGEELTHLFDRFYTGENGNTGIGLALAKEIVDLHGWKLVAYKRYGGILFCFEMRE